MSADLQKLSKEETLKMRKEHIGASCTLFHEENPIKIVRGCGQYLFDENNQAYLDCINNVASVGHSHPHITQACFGQISLLNTNSRFLHDNIVIYAKRLLSYFPKELSICYFVNSGSEANDIALRLARAHTKNNDIVVLEGAYHGNLSSTTDMSHMKFKNIVGGKKDYVHVASIPCCYRGEFTSENFSPEELGKEYAKNVENVINDAKKKGRTIAAFLAESIISCGGQVMLPQGYLQNVYRIVRQAGGVTIADEVQTGFGRSTSMWAFDHQGVCPDIVTIGKPMGNGFPVAAVITTKEISESFKDLGVSFFNTYGGNPTAMAVANAVLDVIERENLMENARIIGEHMKKSLKQLKEKHVLIGDVRGIGMFWGIELVKDQITKEPGTEEAALVVQKLKERHILLSNEGLYSNVLKFKPPMCFNKENVDHLINALDEILSAMEVKHSCSSGYESGSEILALLSEEDDDTSTSTCSKKSLEVLNNEFMDKVEL